MTAPSVKHPDVFVQLTGQNGNVFNIIGLVSTALKRAGLKDEAQQFREEAMSRQSYDQVLGLCMTWVDVG